MGISFPFVIAPPSPNQPNQPTDRCRAGDSRQDPSSSLLVGGDVGKVVLDVRRDGLYYVYFYNNFADDNYIHDGFSMFFLRWGTALSFIVVFLCHYAIVMMTCRRVYLGRS